MRAVLIIRTRKEDSLAEELTRLQAALEDHQVRLFDLTASEPDYESLLDSIFKADSIQVY